MTKIAALFPGQGSQQVGMGRDLAERWEAALNLIEEIQNDWLDRYRSRQRRYEARW